MASQGPFSVGTGADDAAVGTIAWTNPTRIVSSNNSYATATGDQSAITHYLKGTNSASAFSIPTGAIINGIVLEVEKSGSGAGVDDEFVKAVKGGTVSGDNKASGVPWGSEAYTTYGSSSDLWGLSWTAADINATNFGFVVAAQFNSGLVGRTASVDHFRITVYYTETFTATSAVTVGRATVSAAATFTAPAYGGVATLVVGGITSASSATFTTPTYSGTSAVAVGAATLASVATFAAPAYSSSSAVTVGAATTSGSATFSPGVHTATAAITVGAATSSGAATFGPGAHTATAALIAGATTAAGDATFGPGTHTASAALTAPRASLVGSATFTSPVYSGTASLTCGAATLSASALFATVIYSGTSTLTAGRASLAGSASFVAPTYSGSAALAAPRSTCAAAATFTPPSYVGTTSLTTGGASAAGAATSSPPVYAITAALTTPRASLVGSATFVAISYTASAALTVAPAALAGLAAFSPGAARTATATLTSPRAVLGASATYVAPTVAPAADLLHSPAYILRQLLVDVGMGVDPPSTPWPIHAISEPDTPDNVITTYDTVGRKDGRSMPTGELFEHYGVQIRIRSVTSRVGYAKANAIAEAIRKSIYEKTVLVDGTDYYIVRCLSGVGDVIEIGKDVSSSKDSVFTINAMMTVHHLPLN